MTEQSCLICGLSFKTMKGLSTHLQVAHGLTSKQYTVDYLGGNPVCSFPGCVNKTRYVSFTFKKFCKEHAKEAMRVGGSLGGTKKSNWNKGKTKFEDDRILKQAIAMSGKDNHFFGKKHCDSTKLSIAEKKRLTEEEVKERLDARSDFTFPSFSYDDYMSRQHQKIKCKCVKCGMTSRKTLQALDRGSLCFRCYPFIVSKGELEMGDFISEHVEVIRNDRQVIAPYELDVFVPGMNLAFEYHGLYWHMDRGHKGFDKELHQKKMKLCEEKGIQLVQFFSLDWEEKQELVKSMILSRLGKTEHCIGARTLVLDQNVSPSEAKTFFEENHLSGHVKAKTYMALRDKEGQIAQAISLREPFHRKWKDSMEIARFATRKNTQVSGGFSRLLKAVEASVKAEGKKSILSYADLMHGTGSVYERAGFENLGMTALNFWWTDGTCLLNRFAVRAGNGKTEKQAAKEAGLFRVYGCGNRTFLKRV